MASDLLTIFYEKCCEIIINNNNITKIERYAFIGYAGKYFDCLTCVKIAGTNLRTIKY